MYNETYHEVSEETLNWMLAGESAEHQKLIKEQVAAAKAAKKRNYLVELPDGTWYMITNGIVQGSRGYRG